MAEVYTLHPGELAAVQQSVAWQDIRDAYAGAYLAVFEQQIRPDPLAILLAHSALETGRWEAGLWNWNLGNIKASEAYTNKPGCHHQYYRLNEYLKQPDGKYKYIWFDPTHAQTRMRGYLRAADGAAEKVRFLGTASNPAKGNRYQKAWDALLDADPAAFSRELHAAGYYTAQEGPYTRAVVSLYHEYRAELEVAPWAPAFTSAPPLDPADYDHDLPLHSAATDADLAISWIGQPRLGLPDDIYWDLQRIKQEDVAGDD